MTDDDGVAAQLEAISERTKRQYRTTASVVTSTLREAIIRAVFLPGDYLNQYELAEQLGVSRTPVRSALVQLESEGLVVFHSHRGCVVAELDAFKIHQIYDIRCQLEVLAIRRGIETMTDERMRRLEEIDRQMPHADGDTLLDLREEFYNLLYDHDRNPMLVDLIQRLRTDVGRYLKRLRLFDAGHADIHGPMLELVKAKDVEGAEKCIIDHLNSIRERFAELMIKGAL